MAIHPPSDIILDVARAADPARMQAAVDKLARLAGPGGSGGSDFSHVLDATSVAAPRPALDLANLRSSIGARAVTSGRANAYEGLEAVVLQSFVEYMLPKDAGGFFGDEAATGVMRGLLSQEVAGQMAKTGKVGIAKLLASRRTGAESAAATRHAAEPHAAMPVALEAPLVPPGAAPVQPPKAVAPRKADGPLDLGAASGPT